MNQQIIIENWAVDRAEDIRLLASFPVSKDLQLETMAQRFLYYHQYYDQLNSIVFIDNQGFVKIDTASSEVILKDSDISLKDRDYFIAAKKGKEYIYDIVISKASGHPIIIFSSPVLSSSQAFQGVIFGAVHLSRINDMLQQSIQGKSGEITLVNQEGIIVSHLSNNKDQQIEQDVLATKLDPNIFEKFNTVDKDFMEYVNHHGDKVFASFVSLYDGRYFLINGISKKEVLQPHYQMVVTMIVITFIIIVLAFILILPVSKQLLRPFFYMLKAINEVAVGKYHTQLQPDKFLTSPIELQRMMREFNEMATSVQENKKLLQQISNTDGLTGIANRRLFEERLEREWQYAKKHQKPISIVFFVIDFFKKFNDYFGHQKGDQCLITIAHTIDRMINNPNHLLARYGGEEFIIILHNTPSEKAVQVAENVRTQVKKLKILRTRSHSEQFITVSIGVATMIPTQSMIRSSLIQVADQALYEAKSLGRDRIVVKDIHSE